jgi:hypothetical protein
LLFAIVGGEDARGGVRADAMFFLTFYDNERTRINLLLQKERMEKTTDNKTSSLEVQKERE